MTSLSSLGGPCETLALLSEIVYTYITFYQQILITTTKIQLPLQNSQLALYETTKWLYLSGYLLCKKERNFYILPKQSSDPTESKNKCRIRFPSKDLMKHESNRTAIRRKSWLSTKIHKKKKTRQKKKRIKSFSM